MFCFNIIALHNLNHFSKKKSKITFFKEKSFKNTLPPFHSTLQFPATKLLTPHTLMHRPHPPPRLEFARTVYAYARPFIAELGELRHLRCRHHRPPQAGECHARAHTPFFQPPPLEGSNSNSVWSPWLLNGLSTARSVTICSDWLWASRVSSGEPRCWEGQCEWEFGYGLMENWGNLDCISSIDIVIFWSSFEQVFH